MILSNELLLKGARHDVAHHQARLQIWRDALEKQSTPLSKRLCELYILDHQQCLLISQEIVKRLEAQS